MIDFEIFLTQLSLDNSKKDFFFAELDDYYKLDRNKFISSKKIGLYIAYSVLSIPLCFIFFACILGGFFSTFLFILLLVGAFLLDKSIKDSHKISVIKYFRSIDLNYRRIKFDDFPEITNTLKTLLINAGMMDYKLKIFFNQENHFIPAVCERIENQNKYVYFLLTRNLLLLHNTKNNIFKAIICHELGHICQHDTNLWVERNLQKKKEKSLWIAYATSIPLILLHLLGNLNSKNQYIRERKQAEHWADLFSVIISKDFAIIKFLEGNYLSVSEDNDHPFPKTRIDYISKIVNKVLNKNEINAALVTLF
jgi:hypothetical protein